MKASAAIAIPHILAIIALCLLSKLTSGQTLIKDLTLAQAVLDDYNEAAEKIMYRNAEAAWSYYTNITEYNRKIMVDYSLISAKFEQDSAVNLSRFDTTSMPVQMKREVLKILDIGTSAQKDDTKLRRLSNILSEMESIYSTAKACLSPTECLPLEPDLTLLLTESRDYDHLLKAWISWRDVSGAKMKSLYAEFVQLSNEAVRILGHADTGAYWRSWYETPDFEEQIHRLHEQLRPLYENLHAYVRRKLRNMYGEDKFPSTGHIPAHLLGNMWAQEWGAIGDDLMPYKGKQSMDVTDEMVRQKYSPVQIFETADDFFGSLGLIRMPQEFWNKSMLQKPEGREVVCHASAWDFANKKDFRIKQCTEVTQAHFETVHHEMGHIEYYLQYKDLPIAFRGGANPGVFTSISQCTEVTDLHMVTAHHEMGHVEYSLQYRHLPLSFRGGANPGFHEAVGDVMSLSVQTPEHMHSIGLLPILTNDTETDINFLMSMALQKVAFLPFGYLIDQWRWSVFRGDTKPDQYTEDWWELRCKYQGISSPVARTSSDFDPGAKYHIPGNTPYIRYFVSFIIQFQFHKAACQAAGNTGPLHRCDIYNSKEAGHAIGKMLKMGSSRPWPEAMEQITGQRDMDAKPLLDYFQPLLEFLRAENGDDVGWEAACPTSSPDSASINVFPLGLLILLQLFVMFV